MIGAGTGGAANVDSFKIASTTLAAGRLYATYNGLIYSLDPETGHPHLFSGYGPVIGGAPVATVDTLFSLRARPPVPLPEALATGDTSAPLPDVPTLYALSLDRGDPRWTYEEPGVFVTGELVLDETSVYLSPITEVVAVDRGTGKVRWRHDRSNHSGPPATANGTVFLKGEDRTFSAVAAADGRIVWTIDSYEDGYPVARDGVLYTADVKSLIARDVATGKQRWLAKTGIIVAPVPVVADRAVLVWTDESEHNIAAYDRENGKPLWTADLPAAVTGRPAVADGVLYASARGALVAIDLMTGQQRWRVDAAEALLSPPTVGKGMIYVFATPKNGFEQHTVYALPV
jgi:outer membrane protein assembly factor BamB